MENVRKHLDVKLVSNAWWFKKLASKPNFKSFKIFTEDLTAMHLSKEQILLNKPTYVGMSILSKALFHSTMIILNNITETEPRFL